MSVRTTAVVGTIALLFAFVPFQPANAEQSEQSIDNIAGAQVEHILRPDGTVNQASGQALVIPPALKRDAKIHVTTATQPIVDYSTPEPGKDFVAFPDRAPPAVVPRKDQLAFYPCARCHDNLKTNPEPRVLMPVHEVGLNHGGDRFWCLTCHDAKDRNSLHTLNGTRLDFDEAWRVCGQCHQARMKDWYYGAHGKRYYNWKGEPVRYNCTQCHNPHKPPFMHRKPQPPPPVRAGLTPMPRNQIKEQPVWVKHADRQLEETGND